MVLALFYLYFCFFKFIFFLAPITEDTILVDDLPLMHIQNLLFVVTFFFLKGKLKVYRQLITTTKKYNKRKRERVKGEKNNYLKTSLIL